MVSTRRTRLASPRKGILGVVVCGALALSIVVAVARSGPLQLTNIQIGRSLNQDGRIASITTLFKPSETVYRFAAPTPLLEETDAAGLSRLRVAGQPSRGD